MFNLKFAMNTGKYDFELSGVKGSFGTAEWANAAYKHEQSKRLIQHDSPCVESVIGLNQVHSDRVIIHSFSESFKSKQIDGDGLLTSEPDTALIMKTADCVPIVFIDIKKRIIGISHQGWKGLCLHLPEKMIHNCISLGSSPTDLICLIGPSIGQCCYIVNQERADQFRNEFDFNTDLYLRKEDTDFYLDLKKLSLLQINKMGVSYENNITLQSCTYCDKRFFSYRRSTKKNMV